MSAIEKYLRLEEAVRPSPELEKAEPITDEVILELIARWPTIKAWWVFDLMRGAIVRIWKLQAERDEARDCGQDTVCVLSPGCQRHWEERNRELVAERDEAVRLLHMVTRPESIHPDVAAFFESIGDS